MSRYKRRSNFDIVIGWDPPLATFFCQVWGDPRDEEPIYQNGMRRHEFTDIQQFQNDIKDYYQLTDEDRRLLSRDAQLEGDSFPKKAPAIQGLLEHLENLMPPAPRRYLKPLDGRNIFVGKQIVYVPSHIIEEYASREAIPESILSDRAVEYGFIFSYSSDIDLLFCRYWLAGKVGVELKTKANSELTPMRNLFEYDSVAPQIIDNWLKFNIGKGR